MTEISMAGVEKRLDVIIKLLAMQALEGQNQAKAILTLDGLGLDINTIAELVGTTPATVRSCRAKARKRADVPTG